MAQDELTADGRFEHFVYLISSVEKEIARIRSAECANYGLKGSELMLLYQLSREDAGLPAAELARRCGVTRAAVSRTVAALEERSLVQVCAKDDSAAARYRAPLRLTELGRALMGEVAEAIGRVMAQADLALTPERRAQMYDALESVLACLRGIAR